MDALNLAFLLFLVLVGWIAIVRSKMVAPAQPEHYLPNAAAIQRPVHPNEQFLHAVRWRTCYPVLRAAHGFLTSASVVATGILWMWLMDPSTGNQARIYATFACGGVIVALLIEYGLFRLIVDAVDVLIDTGRRIAGQ